MIFIEILAEIRLRISVDIQNCTNWRRILCSIDWWQIQVRLWSKNCRFGPKNHVKSHIVIEIPADIRLRMWVDLQNYTNWRRILCSLDWWQIQVRLWTKNCEIGPKNHVKFHIVIKILRDIRLRMWVDLLNYTNWRRILCSIDWWQIQVRLWTNNWGFGPKNHVKSHIVIEIPADIRLRMWVDILNCSNWRRILCSIDWWQI